MSSDAPPPEDGQPTATEEALEEALGTVDSGARSQARIAIITAVIALISAILGPLVSLAINSTQISSQAKSTKEQRAADQVQASAEFIRNERRSAYADFLSAYNNGAVDLASASGTLAAATVSPASAAPVLLDAIKALKEITADYYTVQLVGSDTTVQKAKDAYERYTQAANVILQYGGHIAEGRQPTAKNRTDFATTTQPLYGQLIDIAADFISTGRTDLNADVTTDVKAD